MLENINSYFERLTSASNGFFTDFNLISYDEDFGIFVYFNTVHFSICDSVSYHIGKVDSFGIVSDIRVFSEELKAIAAYNALIA